VLKIQKQPYRAFGLVLASRTNNEPAYLSINLGELELTLNLPPIVPRKRIALYTGGVDKATYVRDRIECRDRQFARLTDKGYDENSESYKCEVKYWTNSYGWNFEKVKPIERRKMWQKFGFLFHSGYIVLHRGASGWLTPNITVIPTKKHKETPKLELVHSDGSRSEIYTTLFTVAADRLPTGCVMSERDPVSGWDSVDYVHAERSAYRVAEPKDMPPLRFYAVVETRDGQELRSVFATAKCGDGWVQMDTVAKVFDDETFDSAINRVFGV
jgi:hypothetical protein